MASAVNLGIGLISIGVEGTQIAKDIAKQFSQIETSATKTGKAIGQSLQAGSNASFNLDKAEAELASLQTAAEKSGRGVEAALHKSAQAASVVEQRTKELADAQARYGDESSQVIAKERQLQDAKFKLSTATQQAKVAEEQHAQSLEKVADATADVEKATNKAARGVDKVGDESKKARGSVGKLADSFRKELADGAKKAEDQVSRLGDRISKGFKFAGGAALAGAGAAVAGTIGTALSAGFDRLKSIDQAEAKLRGLGHEASSVTSIMDSAMAAVKGTAFGFGDAAEVAATTVAAGVKPGKELERTLKLVGDASTIAGTGMGEMGSIFNKIAASNKIQAEEMNQLMGRGIPIQEMLADHLGVSTDQVRKLSSEGKIGFKDFQAAMEKGLGGAALESGNTFQGAMNNMRASLGRLGAAFLGPAFAEGPNIIGKITEAFDKLAPMAEKAGKWVANAFEFLWDNKDIIGAIAAGIGAAAVAWGAYRTALVVAAIAQRVMNGAMKANPIGIVITAIGALVGILIIAYNRSETFRNIVNKTWEGIKTVVGGVVEWFRQNVVPIFQGIWARLQGPIARFREMWGTLVDWFNENISPKLEIFRDVMGRVWDRILEAFGKVGKWWFKTGSAIWEVIIKFLVGYVQAAIKVWGVVLGGIWDGIVWAFNAVKRWWDSSGRASWERFSTWFGENVTPKIEAFKDATGWLFGEIVKIPARVTEWWETTGRPAWEAFTGWFESKAQPKIDRYVELNKNAFAQVRDGIGSVTKWWFESGQTAWETMGSWLNQQSWYQDFRTKWGESWDRIRSSPQRFSDWWNRPETGGKATWDQLVARFNEYVQPHIDDFKTQWDKTWVEVEKAKRRFTDWWNKPETGGKATWDGLVKMFRDNVEPRITELKKIWTDAWDKILEKAEPVTTWWNRPDSGGEAMFSRLSIDWAPLLRIVLGLLAAMIVGPLMVAFKALETALIVLEIAAKGFQTAWSFMEDYIITPIRNGVNTAVDILNTLVRAIESIAGAIGIDVNIREFTGLRVGASSSRPTAGRGAVPLATGGRVPMNDYSMGGYTGPGAKYTPAGIVHGDEYVIQKWSRNRIERTNPGVLDYMNRTGQMPGYFMGGHVPVPGGRVTNRHGIPYAGTNARYAVDLAMPMGTPVFAWKDGTVAYTRRQNTSYGNHIVINHNGGESTLYAHLSRILTSANSIVRAGQKIGEVGSTGNSSGPHLHFEIRGGTSPLSGDEGGGVVYAIADRVADVVTKPVRALIDAVPGDNAVTDLVKGVGNWALDKATDWLLDKIPTHGSSVAAVSGAPGSLGNLGVTANTARKAEEIVATARANGYRVGSVGGYRGDGEHASRRAIDIMVPNKATGDFIANFVWGNRSRYGLQHIIWWQRIMSVARASEGWRGMPDRGSATQNHYDHNHILFSGSDKGLMSGGYTGNGPTNRFANYVHGQEFVIKADSTKRLNRSFPGLLSVLNNTGRVPDYISQTEGPNTVIHNEITVNDVNDPTQAAYAVSRELSWRLAS